MNPNRVSLIAAILLCMVGIAWAPAKAAEQSVELTDPAGDVQDYDGNPGKDVVKVALTSDGEALLVNVTLAKEATFYLKGHHAGDVVVISLDTDRDASTGGAIQFGQKPGFEMQVDVRSCIEYERGEACVGGVGGSPEKAYFSSFKVGRFEQGGSSPKNTHDIFWKSPRQPLDGKDVKVAVPYSDLGVKSGQTVRLAIREADAGPMAEAYFPDVELTLR